MGQDRTQIVGRVSKSSRMLIRLSAHGRVDRGDAAEAHRAQDANGVPHVMFSDQAREAQPASSAPVAGSAGAFRRSRRSLVPASRCGWIAARTARVQARRRGGNQTVAMSGGGSSRPARRSNENRFRFACVMALADEQRACGITGR